ALHDFADLFGGEADRPPPQRGRRDAGRRAGLSLRARGAAAHASRRGVGRGLRLFDERLDVRDPIAAHRRPLPDAGHADRPVVPADAQRAARLDHGRHPSAAGGLDRRVLDLAGETARRRYMTLSERLARFLVGFAAVFAVVFLMTPLVITVAVS